MGWWAQFDQAVVAADFARIAGTGLVAAVAAFVGADRCDDVGDDFWIDLDRDEFLRSPREQLARLYRRYRSGREMNTRPSVCRRQT